MQLSDVTFIDLEADRRGRPLRLGWVRGADSGAISLAGRARSQPELDRLGPVVAGHNIREFDLPILAGARLSLRAEVVIDSLLVSLLADPLRPTHALGKDNLPPGAVPDPVSDAEASRQRLGES
jgi:hypothetical protein